jgi:hypothetical protein
MVTDLGVRQLWNITLHDTTAPSVIMQMPRYRRLGTRRLGTAFLCISFVD